MENRKAAVPEIIDNVEALYARMDAMKQAQREFATFSQEQVDKIFFAAAVAANKQRIPLAKMAVKETGMGVVEDKVIKNHYAAEYIYNAYKETKTCGVIEEDSAFGIKKVAEPIGLIAAVIPTTNPTSTAIFKTLLALKLLLYPLIQEQKAVPSQLQKLFLKRQWQQVHQRELLAGLMFLLLS